MNKIHFCSQSYPVAAAQSDRVLTPAEQVELICLGDLTFLKGFISENRFDEDVEPEFVETADLAVILLYRKLYALSEKALNAFKTRFGNIIM